MDAYLRAVAALRNRIHRELDKLAGITRELVSREHPSDNTEPLIQSPLPFDSEKPVQTIIRNAHTVSEEADHRLSIAIKDGVIVALGTNEEVAALAGPDTSVIDADGRTVIPGFCDAHMHLLVGAERAQGCDVEDIRAPSELRRRVAGFIKDHPDLPVYYVYGLHYCDPPLIPPSKARVFLDRICADKPLFVYAHDLHTGWANTKAIEISGLLAQMPPYPPIIKELNLEENIILDDQKRPSGEFKEPGVYFLVEGVLGHKYPLTVDQKLEFLKKACEHLASLGLTGIHNMGLDVPEEDIELLLLLLELEQRGELPIKVYTSFSVIPDRHMLEDVLRAARIRDALASARGGDITMAEFHDYLLTTMQEAVDMRKDECEIFRKKYPQLSTQSRFLAIHAAHKHMLKIIDAMHVAGHFERRDRRIKECGDAHLDPVGKVQLGMVKLFMDGVIEKGTAFRADQPPIEGIPGFNQEELNRVVHLADRLGLQVSAHCIGDGSVHSMLEAVKMARKTNAEADRERGHTVRHRVEHIEMCLPHDIGRFGAEGVIASMQALHERPPVTMWHQKVPQSKWGTAFAWKSLMEKGAVLAFGSDWPIVSCNCLDGIHRAINRKPWANGLPDEHLSLETAVDAFSRYPAYVEYREKQQGQLKPGMSADVVILSDNILHVAPESIDHVRPVRTISDGLVVFEDDEND